MRRRSAAAYDPRDHGSLNGGKDPIRCAQQRAAHRPSLRVIRLENLFLRHSLTDHGELPAKIPAVLNAGIHALRAHGTVNVRRIARQKDISLAISGGLSVVEAETREPDGIAANAPCRVWDRPPSFAAPAVRGRASRPRPWGLERPPGDRGLGWLSRARLTDDRVERTPPVLDRARTR